MRWLGGLIYVVCALNSAVACSEKFEGGGAAGAAGDESGSAGAPSEGGSNSSAGTGGSFDDELGGEHAGGATEPPASAGAASEGGASSSEPKSCAASSDCAPGENCVDESCVPALVTCAAQKNKYPASKDGVYWVGAGNESHRAYCDMAEAVELCSETPTERVGRTRDSSQVEYKMTAVLLADGLCKIWNLRGAADGYPFWQLENVGGTPGGQTCAKLGFVGDGVLGYCSYGSTRTLCGYEVKAPHRYGNTCSGCELNDGDFDHWVVQGPIKLGGVLSDAAGSKFTTCKTSK